MHSQQTQGFMLESEGNHTHNLIPDCLLFKNDHYIYATQLTQTFPPFAAMFLLSPQTLAQFSK